MTIKSSSFKRGSTFNVKKKNLLRKFKKPDVIIPVVAQVSNVDHGPLFKIKNQSIFLRFIFHFSREDALCENLSLCRFKLFILIPRDRIKIKHKTTNSFLNATSQLIN